MQNARGTSAENGSEREPAERNAAIECSESVPIDSGDCLAAVCPVGLRGRFYRNRCKRIATDLVGLVVRFNRGRTGIMLTGLVAMTSRSACAARVVSVLTFAATCMRRPAAAASTTTLTFADFCRRTTTFVQLLPLAAGLAASTTARGCRQTLYWNGQCRDPDERANGNVSHSPHRGDSLFLRSAQSRRNASIPFHRPLVSLTITKVPSQTWPSELELSRDRDDRSRSVWVRGCYRGRSGRSPRVATGYIV